MPRHQNNIDPVSSDGGRKNTQHTNIALRFIVVSTHSHRAALHEGHDPLEVSLVNDAPVVLKGLWTGCVKLLQGVNHKMGLCLLQYQYLTVVKREIQKSPFCDFFT